MMLHTEKNIHGEHIEKEILPFRFTNSLQQPYQLNFKAFSSKREDDKSYISNNHHL
jgi:hypothetical protein